MRRCTKPVRSDASARPRRLQRHHHPRRFFDLECGANRAGRRHGPCPVTGGTPDSETKEKCKRRDGLEGRRDACQKCIGRDAPGGSAYTLLLAGGMTTRKTGAAFAYRYESSGKRHRCPWDAGRRIRAYKKRMAYLEKLLNKPNPGGGRHALGAR